MRQAADCFFAKGVPVFAKGYAERENTSLVFTGTVGRVKTRAAIRLTASNLYVLYVNGAFAATGPARAAKGFARVDEIDLTGLLNEPENTVTALVTNAYVDSFYLLKTPGFFQAEVISDAEPLLYTGGEKKGFRCYDMSCRVREAARVNCQRTFVERYRLDAEYGARLENGERGVPLETETVLGLTLLERGAPYPEYRNEPDAKRIRTAQFALSETFDAYFERLIAPDLPPHFQTFPETDGGNSLSRILQRIEAGGELAQENGELGGGSFALYDLGRNCSGHLCFTVRCEETARAAVLFDELLTGGAVACGRCMSRNFLDLTLQPGTYRFESMECNTLRFAQFVVLSGKCSVERLWLRSVQAPAPPARFECDDAALNELFAAAVSTYRQNAVDVFTDCPGRERAGWLCDSFFTARVEKDLYGASPVERDFLENFALYRGDMRYVPEGMLPSVYPADSFDERNAYIPNWGLFFVLEAEEYRKRSGDGALTERLRGRIDGLLAYFKRFEDEYGLLENLPGWVFVEWSGAQDFTEGVNFPTNMLYARALRAAGGLYGDPAYPARAERCEKSIRALSYRDGYFRDNAVRRGGKLITTEHVSEVCQYYAMLFLNLAEEPLFESLAVRMTDCFSGRSSVDGVCGAAAFIGKYLRLEFLSARNETETLIRECKELFLPMAERTGTLWENLNERGSCCHGFASHVVHVFYRDVAGVSVDSVNKTVVLTPPRGGVAFCRAVLPVEKNEVNVEFTNGRRATYRLRLPAGFTVRAPLNVDTEIEYEG